MLFSVSQGPSVPYQFLENRNEQSCTQFSGLRSWERAPAWIPFSDSLQWLSSVTFYLKDYPFCCNWWNFILFNGWVIILLKIYKHAFVLIKYPCSTRDLGPPHPSFCLHSFWRVETCQAHSLTRAFKTSLKGYPVPSWVVQVLCMGFIGFPHNPRDTALSLLFPLFFFFFHRLWCTRPRSVKKTTATGLEKVNFHFNPKETQCQRVLKLLHNCTHLTH